MKILAVIGAVIGCLVIRSEIISLLFLLVGGIALLLTIVEANPNDNW